ncbi:MAG: hypothetical protein H8D43_02590 [Chloroflexi bacterium]|nr:hypothetical protein [Chloroflexota bacterium]
MHKIKSFSREDKNAVWNLMNKVQRYRNFEAVTKRLPSIPTEPEWVWLGHILANPECRIALKGALSDAPYIPLQASDLDRLYSNPLVQALIKNVEPGSLAEDILALDQDCKGEDLIEKLRRLGVQGVDSWAKDLWGALGRYDDFEDFYIEGKYARKWAISGLDVQLKPCGKKGPDVRVSKDGEHIFVEVTRLREDELLAEKQREAGQRGELIEIPITTQQIYSKILGEYHQLIRGAANAILVHSDSSVKEGFDFRRMVPYIREEILHDTTLHSRVNAFIFYDKWGIDSKGTYCCVFVNKHAVCPLPDHFLIKIATALDHGVEFV